MRPFDCIRGFSGTDDCVETGCSAVALDICFSGAWKSSVSKGTEGIHSVAGINDSTCSSLRAVASG